MLTWEESKEREDLCNQENIGFLAISSQSQQLWRRESLSRLDITSARLKSIEDLGTVHSSVTSRLEHDVNGMRQETESLRNEVGRLLECFKDDERKLVSKLRVENKVLKQSIDELRENVALKETVVSTLRDKLNRKLLRTVVENDMLRREVQEEMSRAHLQVADLKKDLHQLIDTAVLNFQRPQYASSVKHLQAYVDDVQKKIAEQRTALHILIESIGARDGFLADEGGSMHSNFPPHHRKELQSLSKEQLLSILDVVSFEDGVLEAVSKALFVRRQAKNAENFGDVF
jgi:hypothetical protein